jgi:uncharacterized protein
MRGDFTMETSGSVASGDACKYKFDWALLGDIEAGRPNLGPLVGVSAYRLMQYSFRDVLERRYGFDVADDMFRDAGFLAGTEFANHVVGHHDDLPSFVKALQDALRNHGIGILRIEEAKPEEGHFVLTVSEDLDCSGLPELGYGVCTYDEGFISALLESQTGARFDVEEVDCWCTGDRTCRFVAKIAV